MGTAEHMETLIYIFDLSALAVVLYYSYINDKLQGVKEEQGPFRTATATKESKISSSERRL